MSTEDLRALAERAETVTGREAVRLAEVHGRIRTARRRRGAAAAAGSAAVALALVAGGLLLAETKERADAPVVSPTPTASSPTESVEVPAGQVTVVPDIRPGDARGWTMRGHGPTRNPAVRGRSTCR